MSKQLYVVEITTEIVVLADDAKEAEALAFDEFRMNNIDDFDMHATDMTYYPANWDDKAIPYGHREEDDPDRTIGEWIKLGAVPKFKYPRGTNG